MIDGLTAINRNRTALKGAGANSTDGGSIPPKALCKSPRRAHISPKVIYLCAPNKFGEIKTILFGLDKSRLRILLGGAMNERKDRQYTNGDSKT